MIIVSGRYPDRLPEIARYSLKDMEQAEKMANEMAYVGFVVVMIGDKPFKATRKQKRLMEGDKSPTQSNQLLKVPKEHPPIYS